MKKRMRWAVWFRTPKLFAGDSPPPELKEVDGLFALGCVTGRESAVTSALPSTRLTRRLSAHRVLLIEVPEASRQSALERFQDLVREGEIEFATPVLQSGDSGKPQILTNEVVVQFKTTPTKGRLAALKKRFGVTPSDQSEFSPNQFVMRVRDANGLRTLRVSEDLKSAKDVEFAVPNYIRGFVR